ncbi:uncharacterized protein LOC143922146 [Arctopsyche grandis]|uniref:uncharacterized protein LOC143922146 n=1 Tax=Arctopsyche grandis TaxID=121162 RepID=UPI00406D6C45
MDNKIFRKTVKDSHIVGIDLGTTNSAVAVMQGRIPIVLKNEFNKTTTPSIVRNNLVGEEAKKYLIEDPLNTIFASKRLMGRKFKDSEIQNYIKELPYKTTSSCNGDIWIKTNLGKFAPSQIGAKILNKMKEIGEKALKHPIVRAVVTVPAYFNDSQRQATKDAGKIAGLDIIRIINEPTAAALAYGLDKTAIGKIAVYDLGGGTFDISILEVEDGVFHVLSTNGNTFLGGEDFDNEFSNFLINFYNQTENENLNKTNISIEKLKEASEKAKIELSNKMSTNIFLENIYPGKDLDLKITREQLENVIKKIANKTIEPCEKALKDAKINKNEIKHVILVGGMTKMPFIRKLVKNIFKIEPTTTINPDEAIAQGAAIQGGVLSGTLDNVLLLDVNPLSLGIETMGGIFSKIINRNTTLPFKETEIFSTSEDNQKEVDISIYQGERGLVKENKKLGEIKLKNITKGPKGTPKISVSFECDSNGILKVSAEDSKNKEKQEIELIPSSGLTEQEVNEIIRKGEKERKKDEKKVNLINFKIKAERILQSLLNGTVKYPEKFLQKVKNLNEFISNKMFNIKEAKKELEEIKKYEM